MSNSVRRDWLFLVLNSQASITRVDPSRWNGQRDRTKTCRPFAEPLSWPRRNWKSSIEPSSRYARAATERNSLASSSTWLSRRREEKRQQRKVKWVEGIGIKMSVLPFPTALSWWWYRSLFLKSQSHNVIDHSIRTLRSSKTIRANRHQSAFPVWSLSLSYFSLRTKLCCAPSNRKQRNGSLLVAVSTNNCPRRAHLVTISWRRAV